MTMDGSIFLKSEREKQELRRLLYAQCQRTHTIARQYAELDERAVGEMFHQLSRAGTRPLHSARSGDASSSCAEPTTAGEAPHCPS